MVYTTGSGEELTTEYDAFELTTPSPPIVTDTLLEQVLTAVGLALFWIYVNSVNGCLIYVIHKTHILCDNVHYHLLSVYMFCDIVACNILFIHVFPSVIANDLLVFSHYYCRILSTAGLGILFTSVHMLAYLALERLTFFKYPLRYNRYFTKTKVRITSLILLSSTMLVTALSDAIFVTSPVTTMLNCSPPERYRYIYEPTVLVVYFLPSSVISLFTLVSLGMLITTHEAQIYAAGDNVMNQQPMKNFVKKVRKHIRMLFSISGTLWLTILPAMILHCAMFFSGVTWQDTDNRSNMTMFILAKIVWCMMALTSSCLNPFIYLTLLSDIRQAAVKRLRFKE